MNCCCQTHWFNGLLQTKDLLLQQVQCARFTTMTCKCSCTGRVDAIHPVLQLNLTWCLNITVVSKEMNSLESNLSSSWDLACRIKPSTGIWWTKEYIGMHLLVLRITNRFLKKKERVIAQLNLCEKKRGYFQGLFLSYVHLSNHIKEGFTILFCPQIT